jgi:hypothetical protein
LNLIRTGSDSVFLVLAIITVSEFDTAKVTKIIEND